MSMRQQHTQQFDLSSLHRVGNSHKRWQEGTEHLDQMILQYLNRNKVMLNDNNYWAEDIRNHASKGFH